MFLLPAAAGLEADVEVAEVDFNDTVYQQVQNP
jgi:hypothetical protein